jgi:hypothetical protein
VDVATNFVLAGHQRSLEQMLQELGFIPLHGPLPPIQVILPLVGCYILCLACLDFELMMQKSWVEKRTLLLGR